MVVCVYVQELDGVYGYMLGSTALIGVMSEQRTNLEAVWVDTFLLVQDTLIRDSVAWKLGIYKQRTVQY